MFEVIMKHADKTEKASFNFLLCPENEKNSIFEHTDKMKNIKAKH